MRRDSNDVAWNKAKHRLFERDNNFCRLMRIISVSDMATLKRNAGPLLNRLDPAHIYPVSAKPEIMYESANLVTLNAYSHSMLDSMKDPITGKSISRSEVYKWWEKIAGKAQWRELGKLVKGA